MEIKKNPQNKMKIKKIKTHHNWTFTDFVIIKMLEPKGRAFYVRIGKRRLLFMFKKPEIPKSLVDLGILEIPEKFELKPA